METKKSKLMKKNAGKNVKKRSKMVMTLYKKVELLDKLKEGISISAVGRMYNVNESTVRSIKKSESKIREAVAASAPASAKVAQLVRNKLIVKVEKELFIWIQDELQQAAPLTKCIIRERAKSLYEFYKKLDDDVESDQNFIASKGWFENFKKRYSLQNLKLASDLMLTECDPGRNVSVEMQGTQAVQVKQEIEEDNTDMPQENWNIKTLGELFWSAKELTDFIVNKDPCIERSLKVVQNINEALTPYQGLLEMMQSNNVQEQTLKETQKRIKTELPDSPLDAEQNLSRMTAEDQHDGSYILP